MKDNKQLTEKELDKVAGGAKMWTMRCNHTSLHHTSTESDCSEFRYFRITRDVKNENRKKVGTVQREINLPRIP